MWNNLGKIQGERHNLDTCQRPGRGPQKYTFRFLEAYGECAVLLSLAAQSCLTLCDPMNSSHTAPLSVGFPRREYWSGLPCPSPGDLPDLRIEPQSPALQADSLPTEPPGKPATRKGGGGGLVTKSCLTLGTPLTVAYQAPLSMTFSRQESWGGLLFPFRLSLLVRLDDFKNTFVSLL